MVSDVFWASSPSLIRRSSASERNIKMAYWFTLRRSTSSRSSSRTRGTTTRALIRDRQKAASALVRGSARSVPGLIHPE
jgi:hypothetical protein